MKYKTLAIERGARGRRFKKPMTIKVPERQTLAEKKLLRYVWESLSTVSFLIPFTEEVSKKASGFCHVDELGRPTVLNGQKYIEARARYSGPTPSSVPMYH